MGRGARSRGSSTLLVVFFRYPCCFPKSFYWTRIGDYLPASWTTQRVDVMRENLAGFVPDGLLVRLSTVSQNADQAQAMLERFARAMLTSVGPAGRRMLIGPNYA